MSQKAESGNPSTTAKKNVFETKAPGWAKMESTSAFRAINFELFVKPNKVVMAVGVSAFLGSLGYILYMNLTDDKSKPTYVTLDADDGFSSRPRVSRWE
ncbi:small integral membrane protein 8-like [Littorina saxatilis]|uniref:Small integral membrane protein 8 n=1 Tax=Littorina saxatilis TaxID=31220 RepID=A0AAN9GHX6_9CAEN